PKAFTSSLMVACILPTNSAKRYRVIRILPVLIRWHALASCFAAKQCATGPMNFGHRCGQAQRMADGKDEKGGGTNAALVAPPVTHLGWLIAGLFWGRRRLARAT